MSSTGDRIVRALTERGWSIAVAESLTGGLLVAELISTPGASAVVRGGVVAYSTELKHTLLGVNSGLLAGYGPVHADVAAQMAAGVRERMSVGGVPATIGISTTGVAGPDRQHGVDVGTVHLGFAMGADVRTTALSLSGGRADIRSASVTQCLEQLLRLLEDEWE